MLLRIASRLFSLLFLLGVLPLTQLDAQTYQLQPDETNSKDVFTYEFGRPGLFGVTTSPRTTNLDTATLAMDNPDSPLGILLATSKSSLETSSDPQTAHSANTWIGFDVSGIPATGAEVSSARLYLYAIDGEALVSSILGQPAFGNPSAASPLPTAVYLPNANWDEKTITWDNEPEEQSQLDLVNVSSVNAWASWDVTSAVQGWLNGQPNHGLFLEQETVVASPTAMTNVAAALYASSAYQDAALRPYLSVTVVPEPSSSLIGWLLAGSLPLLARRKR